MQQDTRSFIKVFLRGRVCTSPKKTTKGDWIHFSVAVNTKGNPIFFRVLSKNKSPLKGSNIDISGSLMIGSYNGKPTYSVFEDTDTNTEADKSSDDSFNV